MRAGPWNNYDKGVRLLTLAWMAAALSLPLAAQDSAVAQGFDHFYNLEYDQAIADFQRAIAQDPNSPDLHNHLAQTVVFREMYRDGALERTGVGQ
jgi:Flp pilus assembly protein TadD